MLALQGDIKAMEQVYRLYRTGRGCPKSYVEAYAYLSVAKSHRDSAFVNPFSMKSSLDPEMESEMSPQVIAQAQKRSLELEEIIENNKNSRHVEENRRTIEQEREKIREEERLKAEEEQRKKSIGQSLLHQIL
jgi:TPR repeat protein